MGLRKILLSWSGGKDSAWALHLLRQEGKYEVVGLLTTINERFRRIAIHGYREALLDEQAVATGLPVWKIDLPFPCTNAEYESRMANVVSAPLRRACMESRSAIYFWKRFGPIG